MKRMGKVLVVCAAISAATLIGTAAQAGPVTVQFDDLGHLAYVPDGYGHPALVWDNWRVVDTTINTWRAHGVVSRPNVGLNSDGNPAVISTSTGQLIILHDGWFSSGRVEGTVNLFVGGYDQDANLVWWDYDTLTPQPQLWSFPNTPVSAILFATNNPVGHNDLRFLADDLRLSVIPAPGAVILASLGAGLVGWMRRRKAL
jgi:hypothetical protein